MAYELRTLISSLLPPGSTVNFIKVTVAHDYVLLQLRATAPTASCPRCAVPSSSVHSRYHRHLTDLPWGLRLVRIQLTVRKFVCRNPSCTRRIFTEHLPDLIAPSARKSTRLIMTLRAIDMALGGQAGVRLAACPRLPT
jgi:transposase